MSGRQFLLGATATVIAIASSPMQAFASDRTYLAELTKYSSKDAGVSSIVKQVGNSNNIKMAKGICSVLDDPEVTTVEGLVGGVIKQSFFNIPAPKLPGNERQKSQAIGGYIAVTTLAGVPEYCSKHQSKVVRMFQR